MRVRIVGTLLSISRSAPATTPRLGTSAGSDSSSKLGSTIASSATNRIIEIERGRVPVKGAARLVNIVHNID